MDLFGLPPVPPRRSRVAVGASAATAAIFLGWSVLLAYQPRDTRVWTAALLAAVAAYAGVRAHPLLPQTVLAIGGAALLLRPVVRPATVVDRHRVQELALSSVGHTTMLVAGGLLLSAGLIIAAIGRRKAAEPSRLDRLVVPVVVVFAPLIFAAPGSYRERMRYGEAWGLVVVGVGLGLALPAVLALGVDTLLRRRRSRGAAAGLAPGGAETP